MPWLKLLHISAVIIWCGGILYLPTLLRHSAARATDGDVAWRQWPRNVFIGVATPAALLAIGSGTVIFVAEALVQPWLTYKLAAVALLVLCHGACGMLVIRAEAGRLGACRVCHALSVLMLLALLGVAWLVLRKPA